MEYEIIIGLEVHAQLKTKSKIFCSCSTEFGKPANENTCVVCLGQPGALPVLNPQVVDYAIMAGFALNCDIQKESIWDRKNYFYPDLPKGYQITQFSHPICLNGHLDIPINNQIKRVGITRIHMEEDAGKSIHDKDENYTCIDLNRAGVPLCEIVSEPDLRSAAEAAEYLKTLRSILRYCDVCDGNMEEGSLRCDANVSLRPVGQKEFGERVEIKNLNSIKFLEKAINYEVERQRAILNDGGKISQETRLFDTNKGVTKTMRTKEDAHDYRYFPDPDLVPLILNDEKILKIKQNLPELAREKATRFVRDYQIPEYDAQVLTAEKELGIYFEKSVQTYNNPKKISNWIMTELLRELKNDEKEIENCPVSPEHIAQLIKMIDEGTLSGKMAKSVFEEMYTTGQNPATIVKDKGFEQVSDTGAIEKIINEVMANNPEQLSQYRSGKTKLFGFFVGQTMKLMQGQGNPQLINDLLQKKLDQTDS